MTNTNIPWITNVEPIQKRDESQPNKAIYKIKRFPVHTADTSETMNLGKQLAAEGRLTRFEIAVQKNAKN